MKAQELCPECGTSTESTDSQVTVDRGWTNIYIGLWRYVCARCGWIWANALQRAHNAKVFSRVNK